MPVVDEYVGNVQAYRSVEITARVEGMLEKRQFTEGADVRSGQLLCSIDPSQYEQSLRGQYVAVIELYRALGGNFEPQFSPVDLPGSPAAPHRQPPA